MKGRSEGVGGGVGVGGAKGVALWSLTLDETGTRLPSACTSVLPAPPRARTVTSLTSLTSVMGFGILCAAASAAPTQPSSQPNHKGQRGARVSVHVPRQRVK